MLPEVLLLSPGFLFLKAPFPLLLMSCLLKIKKFFRYLSNRTAISHLHGLPWWFNSKKKISACQGRRYRRLAFYPWGQEDSSGGGNANPLLPRKSHGQSNLMGYTIHQVAEGRTRLSDSTTTKSPTYK